MNRNVLVLNSGIPMQIWRWEKSIENIFAKRCHVLKYYDDFPLHAGGGREIMKCPAVVMLTKHVKYIAPETYRYSKNNILQRDEFHCQYCGDFIENPQNRELDHVIPKSSPFFPGSSFENVVLGCTICNRQKGNKSLSEMKKENCWNGKPFVLVKKPEPPQKLLKTSRFVTMVNQKNIMWLDYIYDWEKYAKKLGKEHLFDLYEEYLKDTK